MDTLAKQLNIYDQDGWYSVTKQTLLKNGGTSLALKYKNSISKLLTTVYPEYLLSSVNTYNIRYKWDVTRFNKVSKGYWNSIANQKEFLQQFAKKMSISPMTHLLII